MELGDFLRASLTLVGPGKENHSSGGKKIIIRIPDF